MKIRPLTDSDFPAASELLWKSFYAAEKDNTSLQGMETFRDLVDPISLAMSCAMNGVSMFGAYQKNDLVAVGAIKGEGHILMLYVSAFHQRQGFGTKMLLFLEAQIKADLITLNSSDQALSFYRKRGYRTVGERRCEEGILFTPMQKTNS